MDCIFCHKQCSPETLTNEHVFPEALGAQLTIDCVCKSCNDRLGSDVDKCLTENFLIRMLRMSLCIAGKGGDLRSPLHDGDIKGHSDRKGTFHPSGDGTGVVCYLLAGRVVIAVHGDGLHAQALQCNQHFFAQLAGAEQHDF